MIWALHEIAVDPDQRRLGKYDFPFFYREDSAGELEFSEILQKRGIEHFKRFEVFKVILGKMKVFQRFEKGIEAGENRNNLRKRADA